MRIIAGEFRSRKIKPVPGDEVRPTPDRMRESLFSILAPQLEGKVFVDAYAGTGAVGIEALSRGAKRAVFLEKNLPALSVLKENIESLGLGSRATVIRASASVALRGLTADIVFVDPPYDRAAEYADSMNVLGASETPLVIAQHASRFSLAEEYGKLKRYRVLKQGDNSLSFYAPEAAAPADSASPTPDGSE